MRFRGGHSASLPVESTIPPPADIFDGVSWSLNKKRKLFVDKIGDFSEKLSLDFRKTL